MRLRRIFDAIIGQKDHFANECLASDSNPTSPLSSPRRIHSKSKNHKKKSHTNVTISNLRRCDSSSSNSFEFTSSEAYCASTSLTNSDDLAWIVDSGAIEHMSDKRDWFTNFEEILDQ